MASSSTGYTSWVHYQALRSHCRPRQGTTVREQQGKASDRSHLLLLTLASGCEQEGSICQTWAKERELSRAAPEGLAWSEASAETFQSLAEARGLLETRQTFTWVSVTYVTSGIAVVLPTKESHKILPFWRKRTLWKRQLPHNSIRVPVNLRLDHRVHFSKLETRLSCPFQ